MIQREENFSTKQETNLTSTDTTAKISKASSSSTSSWTRLKDPRIVRVSRAFGGKDRHSKVCTVRGLRDRRVRLSVPTAIQLYDLQDRLGLNQPSKVVDWLLNAAKHEIDELPPLQIPPGTFTHHNLHPMLMNSHQAANSQSLDKSQGLKIINWDNDPLMKPPRSSNPFWGKSKDVSGGETSDRDHDNQNNWERSSHHHEEERQQFSLDPNQISSNINFLSRQNNPASSLSNLLNSGSMPNYSSFLRWDPSSLTLSHPPRNQPEDLHNFSLVPLPSNISSVPSAVPNHHQVLVYQPGMSTQSYFPSQNTDQFDPKNLNFQPNNSQLSNSSLTSPHANHEESNTSQPTVIRPFNFSMSTAELLPSENNSANEQNKVDNDFRLA